VGCFRKILLQSASVILLAKPDFESVDVRELTLALMDAVPHTKVWVIEQSPWWTTEPI